MKRILVLLCAVLMTAAGLCACMNTSAGRVEEKATQAVSGMNPTEIRDAVTGKNEKTKPTDNVSSMMETIGDVVATEWQDMVEDGEVEDGDGKVGDLENHDGDGNAAPEDE